MTNFTFLTHFSLHWDFHEASKERLHKAKKPEPGPFNVACELSQSPTEHMDTHFPMMDMHCHSLAMLNWNGDCFVLARRLWSRKRIFNDHSTHCAQFQWNWSAEGRGKAAATHREDVLHGDDEDVVGNQPVPVTQDAPDGLQQQVPTKEKEIEAGHQVAHTEYADPCGSRDEDYGKHKPEEVTKYYHLIHV